MEGLRLPNGPFLSSFGVSELQVLSWNGRGICMSDPGQRLSMGCHIKRLAKVGHILCFQEVHGVEGDIFLQFGAWLPSWKIFVSPFLHPDGTANSASGGVVIAVCPAIALVANFEERFLVPGRCMGLSIFVEDKVLTVVNIHNYGYTRAQVKSLGSHLSHIAHNGKVNPLCCFGMCVGDFNIKAENEKSFKI
jgi:hypothetical protein